MSGFDWLVVLGLAGVLILGWILDELRQMDRRQLERRRDAEDHRRLMREIRRQP